METISETSSMASSINKKSASAVVEVILAFRKGGGYPYFTNCFISSEEEKYYIKQFYILIGFWEWIKDPKLPILSRLMLNMSQDP